MSHGRLWQLTRSRTPDPPGIGGRSYWAGLARPLFASCAPALSPARPLFARKLGFFQIVNISVQKVCQSAPKHHWQTENLKIFLESGCALPHTPPPLYTLPQPPPPRRLYGTPLFLRSFITYWLVVSLNVSCVCVVDHVHLITGFPRFLQNPGKSWIFFL